MYLRKRQLHSENNNVLLFGSSKHVPLSRMLAVTDTETKLQLICEEDWRKAEAYRYYIVVHKQIQALCISVSFVNVVTTVLCQTGKYLKQ